MSTTTKTIQERTNDVSSIIRPIVGTAQYDRLAAYIKVQTGGKTLAATLGDATIPDQKKHELFDNIERIVTNKLWDECPAVAKGQASSAPAAPAPAKPEPAALPTTATLPPPRHVPTSAVPLQDPRSPVDETPASPPVTAIPAVADPMAALATALLPYLLPSIKAQLPAGNTAATLDSATVTRIVDGRLAVLFTAVANGITQPARADY